MKVRITGCPAEGALAVIGGRWKVQIVWHLFRGKVEKRSARCRVSFVPRIYAASFGRQTTLPAPSPAQETITNRFECCHR